MTKEKSKISFYRYNENECLYEESATVQDCANKDSATHVSWINILGIEDTSVLHQAAEVFKIHSLVMEDIQNPNQRAKVEDYGDMLYIVLRMFVLETGEIKDQQISMVLQNNILITFREADFGVFKKNIGDKLVSGAGNLRKRGEDYLLYHILDTLIDQYYLVLQEVSEQIETLEQEIFKKVQHHHLVKLQRLKGEVLYLRRHINPVRDLIQNLSRADVDYFEKENKYFLRDLLDHTTRNSEELDFQRDQLDAIMELFYSLQNQKMNSVIKTLTIISTVFMPLTFLVGVYGMNFKYMPELGWRYGYFIVWGIMLLLVVAMIIYFRRLGWFQMRELRSEKNKK